MVLESINSSSFEAAKNLVSFLGAIHDIGKATPAFQTTKGYINSNSLDIYLLDKLNYEGFTDIHNLSLASPNKTHHALAGQCILDWAGAGEDISSIIGGHHGSPVNSLSICTNQKSYSANYYQVEDKTNLIHLRWKQEHQNIINWALSSCGFSSVNELPKITQPGQVILSGLVIVADWIVSNDQYFPLIPIDCCEITNQKQRISEGWLRWKKSDLWQVNNYAMVEQIFVNRFNFSPRDVQKQFYNVIENINNPGIIILEAPMGIGKTEAALVAVEQLAFKTGRSGLFFGLPTQATSNCIFPRIFNWLNNLSKEQGDEFGIRLAHGKANLNEDFIRYANNVDIEINNGSVIINEWFSGRKKTSLDDFVVGTVDQFLLVALKQKHLALRHLGFSKKVVVIDEVHAYDAYMNQYLYQAIQWMGAYGVPVVILSATLPLNKRRDLIKAYLLGKGVMSKNINPQLMHLSTKEYPIITFSEGNNIKEFIKFDMRDSKNICIKKECDTNIINLIEELISYDGIIGIIVNTVKRAQNIGEKCIKKFGENYVELLHSGFIATDRIKKEEQLNKQIGKGSKRPKRKIIIGTQVIEQSLDIDFDVLISDLAPMDLLIQRIGRLHRHSICRPKHHIFPTLYVLGTSEKMEFDKGSAYVYGDYLLARTQYYLPESILLPNDILHLVQKVYGEEEINIIDELKEEYYEMKQKFNVFINNKENKAKTYRIDKPQYKQSLYRSGSLIGWLNNPTSNESEEIAYAQVRDSKNSIEVIALKKIKDGFGFFHDNKDISRTAYTYEQAKEISKHTIQLPSVLCSEYNIDSTIKYLEQYNIENLANWKNQTWLNGCLGIIFDEENMFEINDFKLNYDLKYGLSFERIDKNGKI